MTPELLLFYEEPEPDRWFAFDRYPRRLLRRLVRGQPRVGGQQRVFLNLCGGLDRIGIPYRINDYRYARENPDCVACVVGKPFVLDKFGGQNPIVFGAAVHSHPLSDPDLLKRKPIWKILVPGEWMRKMWEPYYGDAVLAWPVGIDTDLWKLSKKVEKFFDFLIYDKIRWNHDRYTVELLEPIYSELSRRKLAFTTIRYGFYQEEQFLDALRQCRGMIFLCEHETQGIAYQQALSCNIPILAWDHGGYWQDPAFYPHKVKFGPVTSVPYWDYRCGITFKSQDDFPMRLEQFLSRLNAGSFAPRDYVLENLTLEACACRYAAIIDAVAQTSHSQVS